MRHSEIDEKLLRSNRQGGLLVVLTAILLLVVGSPVEADPPGSQYDMPFMGDADLMTKGGDTLAMSIGDPGVINLGNSKSIDASGVFVMEVGGDSVGGTWEATKLDSFHSFGKCVDSQVCLDTVFEVFEGADGSTWEAGRMRARIVLKDADDKVVARGRLTVTCSLPAVPATPVKDYLGDGVLRGPEGFQVDIGPLHFGDGGRQQRSLTLFRRLAD